MNTRREALVWQVITESQVKEEQEEGISVIVAETSSRWMAEEIAKALTRALVIKHEVAF